MRPFEEWRLQEAAFDLAVSATAFHWVDPEVAYPRVAGALRPTGSLALFWNVHKDADRGFVEAAMIRSATGVLVPDLPQ